MTRFCCHDCGGPVPNGGGHIRSVSFRQVAWCDLCWELRELLHAAA